MEDWYGVCLIFLLFSAELALTLGGSCTVKSIEDVADVIESCVDIVVSDVKVPPGKSLNLTNLKPGTSITFDGTTQFGFAEWTGPLIRISGKDLRITGASGHVIDGNGPLWWDGLGKPDDPKKKLIAKVKPKFVTLDGVNNSVIEGLYIKDAPVHCMTLYSCHNVTITNTTIDNTAGNELISAVGKNVRRGHNTDGFDIGKNGKVRNVTISDCKVINQDDCLAVNAGSDVTFKNNYCSGGHGISIGSIGGWLENEVERVTIENCTVVDSSNGIRIKTKRGKVGRVSNVTFANIRLSNISHYGIIMRGNYRDGSASGLPTGGVPITGLTLRNISGTVAKGGTNVLVLVKNASSWAWSDINVTGGTGRETCTGIPKDSGVSCNVG